MIKGMELIFYKRSQNIEEVSDASKIFNALRLMHCVNMYEMRMCCAYNCE